MKKLINLPSLFRTKPVNADLESHGELNRCLTAWDLTLMGIGAVIGAGVFVLTGVAAATQAGPAIIFAYVLAGIACAFSALSYAELASSIGGCGSAYGYAYAAFGEFIAWIIGWDLLLEYCIACPAVAIGWSGYVDNIITALGFHLPKYLMNDPSTPGGIINLPAVMVILSLAILLIVGIKASVRFNAVMVFTKLFVIAVFIAIAAPHIQLQNWHPFLPFGWTGVASGAALIFFAYVGFDAISTAAEEAVNPQRTLPIGLLASLAICSLIYVVMSGLLTLFVPYSSLDVSSPVAHALLLRGYNFGAAIIAVGAIAGLTTVILVMYYGLTRIFLAMARDGLLPQVFAKVNPKTQTPIRLIVVSGIFMAFVAGFFPIDEVAELMNIGTLVAFCLVCAGVAIMRYTHPEMPRPFKTPFSPLFPALGVILCFYLILHLSSITWLRFGIWMLIGFIVYFTYGIRNSLLRN